MTGKTIQPKPKQKVLHTTTDHRGQRQKGDTANMTLREIMRGVSDETRDAISEIFEQSKSK